jgi:hypothetical protein
MTKAPSQTTTGRLAGLAVTGVLLFLALMVFLYNLPAGYLSV